MSTVSLLVVSALIAVSAATSCHTTDSVDCGKTTNLTCTGAAYTPFCHATNGNNGVCTCEKYCFADTECDSGCRSTSYTGKCVEMKPGSFEKICACISTTGGSAVGK